MTQHDVLTERERVSALSDGQLRGGEFARTVELLADDEDARATWRTYHLVGDVLRSGEQALAGSQDAVFVARLRQRLADEVMTHEHIVQPAYRRQGDDSGANDASFRWKLVAGLASLMMVLVVGWSIVSGTGTPQAAPQLAERVGPTDSVLQAAGGEAQQRMIRDPRLDQLLAAHQQFGGTSALQMPAGFLRNATFERPAR